MSFKSSLFTPSQPTTGSEPFPAWHSAQLLLNYRECEKPFFTRWTHLFTSGSRRAIVLDHYSLWCADIYFHNVFFWLRHLPPVEGQIVWKELSLLLLCFLIPPSFFFISLSLSLAWSDGDTKGLKLKGFSSQYTVCDKTCNHTPSLAA